LNSVQYKSYATYQEREQTPWEERRFFITGANG
jgi:hypothetical protein